jgi:hypothetical protein
MKALYHNTVLAALFLSMTFVLSGCDNKAPAKVIGTVTLDNKPVVDATVTFIPDDGSRISTGLTDKNGRYDLWFSAQLQGATVGTHRVEIRTGSSEIYTPSPGEPAPAPETIPQKYNIKSELTAKLKSGKNTVNFDLTSD